MKHLREDVDEFWRLRIVVTFESGRVHMDVLGPYTTEKKAKEIETRMKRGWNTFLRPKPWRTPDSTVVSIRYIREILPAYGWFPKSDNEYIRD